MHHFLVDRGAQRRRIAAVSLEGRLRAAGPHQLLGQPIQLGRRDARRHRGLELGQHLTDELIRHPEPLDFRRRPVDDHVRPPTTEATAAARSAATFSGVWSPSTTRNVGRIDRTRRAAPSGARRPAAARARRPRCRPGAAPARRRSARRRATPRGAIQPQFPQIRRSVSRSISVSSGTSMLTTTIGCRSSSTSSSACACATVRGNPSRTKPAPASRRVSRSEHDADHRLVVEQPAGVHHGLGPAAELGALLHRVTQDVARRHARNPRARARSAPPASPCRRQAARTTPVGRTRAQRRPASRRTPRTSAHPRRPRIRVFFMKPS